MIPVTLIKLGGSVITNKEVPKLVRKAALTRLLSEIRDAQNKTGHVYIVGHGAGSFAHAPALRYKTIDGFINADSKQGMVITQDSASELNRIVVATAVSLDMPAVSLSMSQSLVTDARKAASWDSHVLVEQLKHKLLPITYGDVIFDKTQGCTIWSTETILSFLAQQLPELGFAAEHIVHITEVAGVLDASGEIIESITRDTADTVKKHIHSTKGFDVTGGMWHKIESSLQQADAGLQSSIISGTHEGNVFNCLTGKSYTGTRIS